MSFLFRQPDPSRTWNLWVKILVVKCESKQVEMLSEWTYGKFLWAQLPTLTLYPWTYLLDQSGWSWSASISANHNASLWLVFEAISANWMILNLGGRGTDFGRWRCGPLLSREGSVVSAYSCTVSIWNRKSNQLWLLSIKHTTCYWSRIIWIEYRY